MKRLLSLILLAASLTALGGCYYPYYTHEGVAYDDGTRVATYRDYDYDPYYAPYPAYYGYYDPWYYGGPWIGLGFYGSYYGGHHHHGSYHHTSTTTTGGYHHHH